jgi:lipoprotein-releasing system ATP-binding protein
MNLATNMNALNEPVPLLEAVGLKKTYSKLDKPVFDGLDLRVEAGATVAIMGTSGSGKSSLLHLLGGLDTPTRGEVRLFGEDMAGLSEKRRCGLRNQHLGFVYQFHHLLHDFSALNNVAMPLRIQRVPKAEALERAAEMLEAVGLGGRKQHLPAELSGGERQRTAIARAMVTRPACLLADEPTGNLDTATGAAVMATLQDLRARFGTAWVLVTHDEALGRQAQQCFMLSDGRLTLLPAR